MDPMTLGLLGAGAIILGGTGIGAGIWGLLDLFDKRDGGVGAKVHDVIYHFNSSALRGQDMQRLHNLRMEVKSDVTMFSVDGDFNVNGSSTGIHDKAVNGIKSGALSFSVPGIDAPVEGTWIAVPDSADEKIEDREEKFNSMFRMMKVRAETIQSNKEKLLEGDEFDKLLSAVALATPPGWSNVFAPHEGGRLAKEREGQIDKAETDNQL